MIIKNCNYCNKKFKADLNRRLFCSKSCSAFSRREIYRKLCKKVGKMPKSIETRRKIGLASSLWKRSKEHLKKLWKGRKKITVNTPKGKDNYLWKGDKVSYRNLHRWVHRWLGKPKECVYCGNEKDIEWASVSHHAKRDLSDYISLCVACHREYDKKGRI